MRHIGSFFFRLFISVVLLSLASTARAETYQIGIGMFDITGPAAEVTMGGFAVEDQKTSGISTRLWARTFIVADNAKRVVFVTADTWAVSQAVKQQVAERIAADPELEGFYNTENVCISATHTHNSVGGFSHYFLYNVPNKGFIQESFFAVSEGIYQSIRRAHANLKPGKILINTGRLVNAGWNRSLPAYEKNPSHERAAYEHNTDKEMLLLRFKDLEGNELGMLNWYAVHPDTIGPENTLISGDTKGHASLWFEKSKGADYRSNASFVAAFAQSNSGDCTPNIPFTSHLGSIDWAGKELEISSQQAQAMGFPWPQALGEADIGKNPVLELITRRQYEAAKQLYDTADEELFGPVDFRHKYVDFQGLYVEAEDAATCPAGMGASYSAGSPADNPTPFPLYPLGMTTDELLVDENTKYKTLTSLLGGVAGLASMIGLADPYANSQEYRACQEPKPVILPTGLMYLNTTQIPMTPQILPIQVFRIGSLALTALPFEVTTMAGRRLKTAALDHLDGTEYAALACLSNAYASYMATEEEYSAQYYAGAGTLFGPKQLKACIQETTKLYAAISEGLPVPSGPKPRDLSENQWDFTTGVVMDDTPLFEKFGAVYLQPALSCNRGDRVQAVFWGGHPRNTLTHMMNRKSLSLSPFAEIEMQRQGAWEKVYFDWDPQVIYEWERNGVAYSLCTVSWDTSDAESGIYRIRQKGHWKSGWTGEIYPYEGVTEPITVY